MFERLLNSEYLCQMKASMIISNRLSWAFFQAILRPANEKQESWRGEFIPLRIKKREKTEWN